MPAFRLRLLPIALCTATLMAVAPAAAQSGNAKPEDQNKNAGAAAAAAKERQRQIDQIVEARNLIKGAGGDPECVWLGRRIVSLMWRDDLDTAFRHLDLYDRFGCPGSRVQMAFRCLIRNGNIDPKVPEALNNRIHACWLNPDLQATAAAGASPPAGQAAVAPVSPPATPQR